MTEERTVVIEPVDPLLLRDGRPFGDGGFAESVEMLRPQTLAGALRTHLGRVGNAENPGLFPKDKAGEFKNLAVYGPLLWQENEKGEGEVYLPKPFDCLLMQEGEGDSALRVRRRCVPVREEELADVSFDSGFPGGLLPVMPPSQGKPMADAPYWSLSETLAWRRGEETSAPAKGAEGGLKRERRVHVAIDKHSGVCLEGKLFGTTSLRFRDEARAKEGLAQRLLARYKSSQKLERGYLNLGGENRVARVQPTEGHWPDVPESYLQSFDGVNGLALQLVTPALFKAGLWPDGLDSDLTGASLDGGRWRLRAVASSRALAVSGWDLEQNASKRTRLLVPAGSVFFMEILEGSARSCAEKLWLRSLCEASAARDGYGLVLPGPWKNN